MERSEKNNLTEGGILQKLLAIALPVIGTQIIQMTYNLTDMFWLGRLDAYAVAASGTVGMYLWLSMAFLVFGARGAEIGVSQNIGRGDRDAAQRYAQTAVAFSLILGALYGAVLILFRHPLVGFFGIREPEVTVQAVEYLAIIGLGVPFSFVTASATGTFNGSGNSRLPFYVNAVGLATNMVLDPLLIHTYGMGVRGAAIATVLAQVLACVLIVVALRAQRIRPFEHFRFLAIDRACLAQILRWVTPIALESFLFTFLSMIIARFVTSYGATAMAVQRVGSQVESLSWLIGGGYSIALTSFVGQNYGARRWNRIHRGVKISTYAMLVWGSAITAILYFGAAIFYRIFIPGDASVVEAGKTYLHILALCQIPSCFEGISAGAFRGTGRTVPPSIASITCNALRVVAAWYLSTQTPLGLNGIWWALSMGAAARGIWIFIWYRLSARKMPKEDEPIACGTV